MAIPKIGVFYIQLVRNLSIAILHSIYYERFREIEMILRIDIKLLYPWRLQSKIAFTSNVAPVASNYNDIKAVNEPTLCN